MSGDGECGRASTKWKCRLTGGFHFDPIWGKLEMSAHRRVSRRVCGRRMESGSRQSNGQVLVDSNAARRAFELAEARKQEGGGNGRVHFARGVAVEVMHAFGADERGQRRRTGTKCRRGADAGRPRRRARLPFRHGDNRVTERLQQRLSPKPKRIRRWCS